MQIFSNNEPLALAEILEIYEPYTTEKISHERHFVQSLHGKTAICSILTIKPQPIMLKFLPIMLLSNAQKVSFYAQYYAHDYCNYTTVHTQINNWISIYSWAPD